MALCWTLSAARKVTLSVARKVTPFHSDLLPECCLKQEEESAVLGTDCSVMQFCLKCRGRSRVPEKRQVDMRHCCAEHQ